MTSVFSGTGRPACAKSASVAAMSPASKASPCSNTLRKNAPMSGWGENTITSALPSWACTNCTTSSCDRPVLLLNLGLKKP